MKWFPNPGSLLHWNGPYSSHAPMLGLNPASYAYGSATPALPSPITFEESGLGKLFGTAREKFSEHSPKVAGYLKSAFTNAAIGAVTKLAFKSALHTTGFGGAALAASTGTASVLKEMYKDYSKAIAIIEKEERKGKRWAALRSAVHGNGKKYATKFAIGAASSLAGAELMGHLMSSTHLTDHLPSMHMPSFLTRAVNATKELFGNHHPAPSLGSTHAAEIALSAPVAAPLSVPVALPELSLHDQLANLAQDGHLDKHAQATLALAMKGNLGAQREMADSMLNHGRFGFAENKKLAVNLLKKLSGEGDLKSQANLNFLKAQKKFADLVGFDAKVAHNWFVPKTGVADLAPTPAVADSANIADFFPATPIPAPSAESFLPAFAAAKEAMSCAATQTVDGSMLTDCAPTAENFIPGNTVGLKVMFNNGVQKVWDLLIGPDATTMSTGQYLKKAVGSALEKIQGGSEVLALNLNKDY